MKKKTKTITPTTGRRGRKPGVGVLRQLDPQGSFVGNAAKLVFGHTADDPIAELVRKGRYLAKWREKLTARRAAIGEARIQAVESQVLAGQRSFTKAEAEAVTVCGLLRWWNKQWNGHRERLHRATEAAMASGNADWFSAVAKAIEADKDQDRQNLFPIHEALLLLAMQREGKPTFPSASSSLREILHARNSKTGRRWVVGDPIDATPRYTINQVCKKLEAAGLRPSGMSDESWQRRVRTVCNEVGFPWRTTSNPQTESNRQRFTPARLGLPKNYGTSSFWRRNDLMDQLEKAQAGYRALMLRVHPDKGGDAETFHKVKRLWQNVKNRFKKQGVQLT